MTLVSFLKLSSIILTAMFGAIGLLTDFKDKATNKITRWGYVLLVGILLSTAFGLATQLREDSEKEKDREAALKQTLAIVSNTSRTVQDIQRLLTRIEDPEVYATFALPCGSPDSPDLCGLASSVVWIGKPVLEKLTEGKGTLALTVCFIKDTTVEKLTSIDQKRQFATGCDLQLRADQIPVEGFNSAQNDNVVKLALYTKAVAIRTEKIASINDLKDSVVEVAFQKLAWPPVEIGITTRDGIRHLFKPEFKKILVGDPKILGGQFIKGYRGWISN